MIIIITKQDHVSKYRLFHDKSLNIYPSVSHCPRDAYFDSRSPLRCYKVFKTPLSWSDAARSCDENGGGRLVAIPNHYSLRSIRRALKYRPPNYWTALNDVREEDSFVWTWGVSQTRLGSWSNWLKVRDEIFHGKYKCSFYSFVLEN